MDLVSGRSRAQLNILQCTTQNPSTKNYLGHDVSSVKVEKPWSTEGIAMSMPRTQPDDELTQVGQGSGVGKLRCGRGKGLRKGQPPCSSSQLPLVNAA